MANTAQAQPEDQKNTLRSIREIIIAITISFTMAFVFRGFVVEGFLIPTGSMAPTLLGQHIEAQNPANGYTWDVGPWQYANGVPLAVQGVPDRNGPRPVSLNDPNSGDDVVLNRVPILGGERVFVLKYLKGINPPRRWDITVFKAPHVNTNYIKRTIGVPGDQLALVDGDVFYRPDGTHIDVASLDNPVEAWNRDGWLIARKPEAVQRAMWQSIFDSLRTPASTGTAISTFRPPFESEQRWEGLRDDTSYRYESASPTTLSWDERRFPLTDYTAYNQLPGGQPYTGRSPDRPAGNIFPVSDVAIAFGVEPDEDGLAVTATLAARDRLFRAHIEDDSARLTMTEPDGTEREIANAAGVRLRAGTVTSVEFWHSDQALWLFVNDELVCGGPEAGAYAMSPAQRIDAATTKEHTMASLFANPDATPDQNLLSNPRIYRRADLDVAFEGSALTLHRVRVARDIHYQLDARAGRRTYGGHPAFMPILDGKHYFLAGDNSPSSLDCRFWPDESPPVEAWIEDALASPPGQVHEDLLIGKAFIVYLPAPRKDGPLPVMFDFGRMRWTR